MFFKSHYGTIVTVIIALVMGFLMALASIVVDHLAFNFSNVFKIWAMIALVVLLASLFIPYKDWSNQLTKAMGLVPSTLANKLVGGIIPSLVLNTLNTVIVSAANILGNEAIPAEDQVSIWLKGIVHDWPIMFILSYLAAFVAETAGIKVAKKYTL